MGATEFKRLARIKRQRRIRKRIKGTSGRPRLCVFRSAKHIYAQIIDDVAGRTLVAATHLGTASPLPGVELTLFSFQNQPIETATTNGDGIAILDGTDAVMLSAETAAGKYPALAVAAMDRVCRHAEKQRMARISDHRINTEFKQIDEAIAMSAMYAANHLGAKAIAALTESGATALWMSRISSGIPIYALTSHVETRRKVTLYRGVYPVSFEPVSTNHAEVNQEAIDE